MSIVSEFKEFAAKGSVLDLAVGVIIGAAFAKIVVSLTDDLIMPVGGMLFGGLDFPTSMLCSAVKSRREWHSMPHARPGRTCWLTAVS